MEDPRARGSDVMWSLASLHEASFDRWMERILSADADAIGVARVSYWSLQERGAAIRCEALFVREKRSFESGTVLRASDYPSYFSAMRTGQVIDATDAHTDPRTREFSESYLRPLGIGAMLDVPVFVAGGLHGVVCHEHIGPARTWSSAEQQLALSIGQSLALAIEVEARRKAESAVRTSERRFRAIVEAAPVPMIVTRVSDGRCLYANEQLARLSGVPLEQVTERSAPDFYADREERDAFLAALRKQGHVRDHELRLKRADGSVYWASLSAQPVNFDGHACVITGIADLTDRKAAEGALLEAHAELEAANIGLREALGAVEARDARLLEDLDAARAFQQSSLPEALHVPGLEIDAQYRPLEGVGGDIYDLDQLSPTSVRVFVADATGHGVSAALATMFVLSEYDVARRDQPSPAGVLGALNRRITRRFARLGLRFTAICLDLDVATGTVRWSSAAHPGPLVASPEAVRELPTGGTFVGVTAEATFPEWEDQVAPGEAVCVLTDGVTDVFDVTGEGFGEARLHETLREALASSTRPAAAVGAAVERFLGNGNAPYDDATLVVLRRVPITNAK
ncbi:MAG: SpoIIE family protein phosphatase [Deltaproteobacteria bacterium]|nr:SpoIIE family protein phosphatase [Deltaproteobacteria bacterium]